MSAGHLDRPFVPSLTNRKTGNASIATDLDRRCAIKTCGAGMREKGRVNWISPEPYIGSFVSLSRSL